MGFFSTAGKITAFGRKFIRLYMDCKELKTEVGFEGDYETGLPVSKVALWQEYGTWNIPARPFMRQAARRNKFDIVRVTRNEFHDQLNGNCSARKVLEAGGEITRDYVVKEIDRGDFIPNAPATIAKKGHGHPLIDTGKLRSSVTYVIVDKKG